MTGAPIACTLGAGDFGARLASIAELNRDALRGHERSDLRLMLRYDRDAAARVQEMVQRERECCAFLDFEISESVDSMFVRINAPERARIAAETLFEQFVTGRAVASPCGCQ
mgnify:CR=1 FL=1